MFVERAVQSAAFSSKARNAVLYLEALAINGNCMGDFKPQYVGCVVVGTSEGRAR